MGKIKYGKYKTLSQPAKCLDCQEKRIKYAYHTRCIECVEKLEVQRCAKCGQETEEFVNEKPISQAEQARKDAEFQRDLKALPERRRRTFLRYLNNLEKESRNPECEGQASAKQKLDEIVRKYGREDGKFDLDDLGDDFDDDFDDLEESEEEED